jgi:hypothetical protein
LCSLSKHYALIYHGKFQGGFPFVEGYTHHNLKFHMKLVWICDLNFLKKYALAICSSKKNLQFMLDCLPPIISTFIMLWQKLLNKHYKYLTPNKLISRNNLNSTLVSNPFLIILHKFGIHSYYKIFFREYGIHGLKWHLKVQHWHMHMWELWYHL